MCDKRSNAKCRTVAVRYRFLRKRHEDGTSEIIFLPHEVQKLEVELPEENVELDQETLIEDVNVDYLRSLDPREWKKQDHYKVLGISKLRHEANDETIKTAYRKVVLKHHPDKRKALGEEIKPDDDYYTCITMAYDILGTPSKRRSYDSVDPEFDDSLPTPNEMKRDFYKCFRKYFNRNARWSEKKRVPDIGKEQSTREEVDRFYSFWYDFKSWREYSYEDEEERDKCSDREERRYVDKLNKAERLRKKRDEMSRIRQLVDMAYNADPRIAKFKAEDKERKLAAKRARQSAIQAKRDEEERIVREAQAAKERAEAAERARIEAKRQEREVQKKALKKERKAFRDTCKTNENFASNPDDNLRHLQAIERICEQLSAVELSELTKNVRNEGAAAFKRAVHASEEKAKKEAFATVTGQTPTYQAQIAQQVAKTLPKSTPEWSTENVQLLIKAVNLFPAGTGQRWEVCANFINQHGEFPEGCSGKFTAKMVLAKAKDMQSTDFSRSNLKQAANKDAFDNFIKEKKVASSVEDVEISKSGTVVNGNHANMENDADKNESGDGNNKMANGVASWTTTEQQLLEQALKTYPASTGDRWDRIAECIPNRSKKECMRRYKELVETIKAKRAAQAAAK